MPAKAVDTANEIMKRADLVFVIGTSLTVKPASLLPTIPLRRGVPVVMVNLHPTAYDDWAAGVVREPAGAFFAALSKAVFGE